MARVFIAVRKEAAHKAEEILGKTVGKFCRLEESGAFARWEGTAADLEALTPLADLPDAMARAEAPPAEAPFSVGVAPYWDREKGEALASVRVRFFPAPVWGAHQERVLGTFAVWLKRRAVGVVAARMTEDGEALTFGVSDFGGIRAWEVLASEELTLALVDAVVKGVKEATQRLSGPRIAHQGWYR